MSTSGLTVIRFCICEYATGADALCRLWTLLDCLPLPGGALAFHRVELHEALARSLPADSVRFGCSYSPGLVKDGDVLIGADGIYSAVREQLRSPVGVRYSGFTCWRGICRNPGIKEAFEDWGGAVRIGVVPLTQNRVYVFLVQPAPPGPPAQTSIASIRAAFASFASPVPAVLDALSGIKLLQHDIEELERPVWGRNRTVLIGDAAHAMTPNQGQGASMAIEDAIVLPHVVNTKDPAMGIAVRRNSRVAQIQRTSRWLGKLAHWQSPIAVSLRNLSIRGIPDLVAERKYAQLMGGGPDLERDDTGLD